MKPDTPSAPDPVALANSQTESNKNTAAYNAALNRYNTSTPTGTTTWTQTGIDPSTGAPMYGQSSQLDASSAKSLNNLNNQVSNNLSNPANLQTNVNWGSPTNQAAIQQNYTAQKALLDPQFNQAKESLTAQLANQGIVPGSQAYNNAMNNQAQQQNLAYTTLSNNAAQTGFNQALQGGEFGNTATIQNRDLPLNERASLINTTPAASPGGSYTSNPTDTMTSANNAYNIAAGQAENNQSNLFGLGGSILGSNTAMNGISNAANGLGGLFGLGGTASALGSGATAAGAGDLLGSLAMFA